MAKKDKDRSRVLLGLATVASALTAAPAMAQSVDEDIVITAERRTQSLNDVPISATVLTGDALSERGVNSALDLQNVSPATVINVYNRSTYINIRGVGLAVSAPNVFQGVPIYMNGAVQAYDSVIRGSFYDIASVEVLRGPQGTLTGLNSTGGAIYMRSRAPELGSWSATAEQSFSDYSGSRTVLAGNIPIGDTIALRVAAMNDVQDSFTHNTGSTAQPGDLNNYGVRADLLWRPMERLRMNLRAEYYRSDTDYNAVKRRDDVNLDPFTIGEDGNSQSVINNLHGDLEINFDATEDFSIRFQSSYGEAYQFDYGDRNRAIGGGSNNLALTRIDPRAWSQELDIISTGDGPLQWVLGAFYLDTGNPTRLERFVGPVNPTGGTTSLTVIDVDNRSQAVFGQITYDFDEQWQLMVGARYSEDRQDFTRIASSANLSGFPTSADPGNTTYQTEETTGRIALNYHPSENTLVYGSFARGYRAGGVNLTRNTGVFVPETNVVFELGAHSTILDGRLQVNGAVFRADSADVQFSSLIGAPPSPLTANAPSGRAWGAELELLGRFDDLRFNLGFAYLNNTFDEDAMLQDPARPSTDPAQLVPAGRRMTFSPENTLNFGVQYDFHIFNDQVLTPRIQYAYVAEQYATPFADNASGPSVNARNSLVPDHGVWDFRLTYQPTDQLRAELFINNFVNSTYIASQLQNSSSQTGGYLYGAPRVAGVRLSYSYGE